MNLLLIEIFHLMGRNDLVVIEVNYREPILQTSRGSLVFFREHEPDKVFIAHLIFCPGLELARNLLENAIHCFSREGMTFITREVFLINKEIVVSV